MFLERQEWRLMVIETTQNFIMNCKRFPFRVRRSSNTVVGQTESLWRTLRLHF